MNEQAIKDAIVEAAKELAAKNDWTIRDDGDYGPIDEQSASQFVNTVFQHVAKATRKQEESKR
jgi:hypothetical protein